MTTKLKSSVTTSGKIIGAHGETYPQNKSLRIAKISAETKLSMITARGGKMPAVENPDFTIQRPGRKTNKTDFAQSRRDEAKRLATSKANPFYKGTKLHDNWNARHGKK